MNIETLCVEIELASTGSAARGELVDLVGLAPGSLRAVLVRDDEIHAFSYTPGGYMGTALAPQITPYVPPAPTGWKSVGRRKGPDPNFATAVRKAGEA